MANMTYVEAINFALTVMGDANPEATEKLNALAVQIAKRGTKTGLTKTQKANEALKVVILDILADAEEFMYMADLMADERLAGLSPQKMGALLGQLVKADEVVKHVHKKCTIYAVKGGRICCP